MFTTLHYEMETACYSLTVCCVYARSISLDNPRLTLHHSLSVCLQVMKRLLAVGEDRPMNLGHLVAREKDSKDAQVILIGDLN
jgi:hypothetical protein